MRNPHPLLLFLKSLLYWDIIRAVRSVSTQSIILTVLVKHISQYGIKVDLCNYVTSWGGRRELGRERGGPVAWLMNTLWDSLSLWGKNQSMMVRTAFKHSFMCDHSLPVWANIKTGWGQARKTNRQPLTLIIGLSKLESGYKGKTRLHWGHIIDASWECVCVCSCLCLCYLLAYVCVRACVSHESDCVSTYIKTPM